MKSKDYSALSSYQRIKKCRLDIINYLHDNFDGREKKRIIEELRHALFILKTENES